MKKFATGFIAIVYLLMVSGISVDLHYCMGKLAGVQLYHTDKNSRCGRCGMDERENPCCHDEHNFVKLDDAHKTVFNNIAIQAPAAILTPVVFYNTEIKLPEMQPGFAAAYSPPDDTGPSACVLHCVFRI